MTTANLQPPRQADSLRAILSDTFDGVALTCVEFHGRLCFLAREIGEALGYSQGGTGLVTQLTRTWADELTEGVHFDTLRGEDLVVLKGLVASDAITPRTPNATVLYEEGLHLALLKTTKPAGVRLRAWLAERAMPALARGRAVDARGDVTDSTPSSMGLSTAELRERRLTLRETRLALARMVRAGEITERHAARLLREAFVSFVEGHLSPAAVELARAGARLGIVPEDRQFPARVPPNAVMLPEEAEVVSRAWLSPRGIAAKLQMPGSPRHWDARVGRAITGLGKAMYADEQGQPDSDGLRKDPSLAKSIVVNKQGAGDTLQVDGETGEPAVTYGHLYHPVKVPQMVRVWLMQHKPEWLGLDPDEVEAARRARRARQAQQREAAEILAHRPA